MGKLKDTFTSQTCLHLQNKKLRIVHSRSSTRFSNSFCSLLRECLEYRNSASSTLHTEEQAFSTGVASTAAQCGVDNATVKLFERMAYLKFTHCPKSISSLLNAKRLSRVTKKKERRNYVVRVAYFQSQCNANSKPMHSKKA